MKLLFGALMALFTQPTSALDFSAPSGSLETMIKQVSTKHGISARLYTAILKHESGLRVGAYNAKTHDYGIAQINRYTIKAYKLDKHRLLTDAYYSADAGAKILGDFKAQYEGREPTTWVCHYNLGSKPLIGHRAELCIQYLNRVAQHMPARTIAGEFK